MKRVLFSFSIVLVLFISCKNPIGTDASKKIEKIIGGDGLTNYIDRTSGGDEGKDRIENGKKLTVSFNSNGGSDVASEQVTHGEKASEPHDPTKTRDYRFDGWYKETELTNEFDFARETIVESITLYAKWIKIVPPHAFKNQSFREVTEEQVPPGTVEIADEAFAVNYLRTLTNLPTSLRKVGVEAFRQNTELTEVAIPEGVTEIDDRAFYQCLKITMLTLPSTLKKIGNAAFYTPFIGGSLTRLTLPEGLQYIGTFAFNSHKISQLVIPRSVTFIGDYAFEGNNMLTVILTRELYENIKAQDKLGSIFGPSTSYRDHEGNRLY